MTTQREPIPTCDNCDKKCSPNYRDHNEELGGVFCATCTKALTKAASMQEVAWPEGTAKLYRPLFHKLTVEVLGATRESDSLRVAGVLPEDVAAVWAQAVTDLLAWRRSEDYKALNVDTRAKTAEVQVAWHTEYLTRELKKLAR